MLLFSSPLFLASKPDSLRLSLSSTYGFPRHRRQHGSGRGGFERRPGAFVVVAGGLLLLEEAEEVRDQEMECRRPLGMGYVPDSEPS